MHTQLQIYANFSDLDAWSYIPLQCKVWECVYTDIQTSEIDKNKIFFYIF
jgi:hypothetical protein